MTPRSPHLMPRARGFASPLGRAPRAPPRAPLVCVPPRLGGGNREPDPLDLGAGVWNLGADDLVEDGLSTKDVSVVLCAYRAQPPQKISQCITKRNRKKAVSDSTAGSIANE